METSNGQVLEGKGDIVHNIGKFLFRFVSAPAQIVQRIDDEAYSSVHWSWNAYSNLLSKIQSRFVEYSTTALTL